MEPLRYYHVRPDADTGQLLVVKGTMDGDYEVVGPYLQTSDNGAVHIVQAEMPEWFGLPQYWVDAAANVDDTYFDLGTAAKDCTSASLYVETNDAIVSFDGGTTDHFFVDVGAGQILITGLKIAQGAVVSGKNAVATSDYTNLRVAIW